MLLCFIVDVSNGGVCFFDDVEVSVYDLCDGDSWFWRAVMSAKFIWWWVFLVSWFEPIVCGPFVKFLDVLMCSVCAIVFG